MVFFPVTLSISVLIPKPCAHWARHGRFDLKSCLYRDQSFEAPWLECFGDTVIQHSSISALKSPEGRESGADVRLLAANRAYCFSDGRNAPLCAGRESPLGSHPVHFIFKVACSF